MIDATRIRAALTASLEKGEFPGAVGVVADRTGVVVQEAVGLADSRDRSAMREDQVFRIASMTKLATTLVTLQLLDEGAISLDDDVAAHLPRFGELPVLDHEALRPATGSATIRSLLTHTSGLGYDTWSIELDRYLTATGGLRLGSGRLDALLEMPLLADPGTAFHYGTSMDWLGLVLEKVTGSPIDELYRERLFEPLGMADTTVWAKDDPRLQSRLAAVHIPGPDGWLGIAADYWSPNVTLPEFFPAGHCLYSTAADFLQLQRVVLAGGSLDGVRIAPEALIDELFRNHIGGFDVGIIPTADEGASVDVDLRGYKWSLGLLLSTRSAAGMRSPGSAGWEGGFNTFYWMDRDAGITAALHTATLPFHDPRIMSAHEAFERAVYQA